jgi:1,5-rhamnosyltransferase
MSGTKTKNSKTVISIIMIGFWPDYERQCFEAFTDKNIEISIFDPRDIFKDKKYKSLVPRNIKNFLYKKKIKQIIGRNTESIFVFQDSRVFIEFLLSNTESRSHVLFRNTISEENIPNIGKLKSHGHILWSFDKDDCSKYKIYHYNQFSKYIPGIDKIAIQYDFSFIGRDKNRGNLLNRIKKKLEDYGFSVYIKLITDKESTLPYMEYLKESCRAKCFIDITKEGQSGLTLRPIEAAYYNRKLLTNNKNILNSELYNNNNVLLTDELKSAESISSFLESNTADVPERIMDAFNFDALVEKILDHEAKN